MPRIRPSRGTHLILAPRGPAAGGRRDRARPATDARSSRCPGSGARSSARPTTTTRASSSTCGHRPRTSTTCSRPSTTSSAPSSAPDDLAGAFAGVRPLISTGDPKKSVDISRKAELYETSSGMITITGGKLTTWRRMAKMTVDRLVERDARDAPCRTHEIPLGQAIAAEELPRVEGVPADRSLRRRWPPATAMPPTRCSRSRAERRRAGPADRPRPARPAGRGGAGGAQRAGAQHRRRAPAPHPPGAARRARAGRGGQSDRSRCRRARARARLEPGAHGSRRSSASPRRPRPRGSPRGAPGRWRLSGHREPPSAAGSVPPAGRPMWTRTPARSSPRRERAPWPRARR